MQSISRSGHCCLPPLAFAHGHRRKTLFVRALPHRSAHLQLLRPGSPLLHRKVCQTRTTQRRPCRRCRYQTSRRGRHAHAERQRRYRAKQQEVTHQGSPPTGPSVPLSTQPTAPVNPGSWHCCRCHRPLPDWVRQDFLRCRIRRHQPDRSPHGHSP